MIEQCGQIDGAISVRALSSLDDLFAVTFFGSDPPGRVELYDFQCPINNSQVVFTDSGVHCDCDVGYCNTKHGL